MVFRISQDIDRIELHDSNIINVTMTPDNINLSLNWAKVREFKEQGLGTVVLGKCDLKLNGVKRYEVSYESKAIENPLELAKKLVSKFDPIGENSSKNDKELSISLLMKIEDQYVWAQWMFEFDAFEFSWEQHVTLDEWKNGKLPNELGH